VQAERLDDGSAQIFITAAPGDTELAEELETSVHELQDIQDCTSRQLAMSPAELIARKRTLFSNPFRYDRPVRHMGDFVGRERELEEVKQLVGAKDSVNLLAVHGSWRIGKTSLLRFLEQHDADKLGSCGFYLDCQGVADLRLQTLLAEIVKVISIKLRDKMPISGIRQLDLTRDEYDKLHDDPMHQFQSYLERMLSFLATQPTTRPLIMLDEFSELCDQVRDGRLDARVFSNLRNLIEGNPRILFVLVFQAKTMYELSAMPPSAMGLLQIARMLPLRSPDPRAMKDLFSRRARTAGLTLSEDAATQILEWSGANPYVSNLIAHVIVEGFRETGESIIEAAHVEPSVTAILREAAHGDLYFRQLCELIQSNLEWSIVQQIAQASDMARLPESAVMQVQQREVAAVPHDAIRSALRGLADRGILLARQEADDATSYQFAIPLFARWLRSPRARAQEEKFHA
jgi:hypothetical protein